MSNPTELQEALCNAGIAAAKAAQALLGPPPLGLTEPPPSKVKQAVDLLDAATRAMAASWPQR